MTEPVLISDARPRHIAKRRSLHTNNPHRLEGLDGRTSHGRRFRDLTDELAGEFGHASASALRELVGIRMAIETATAAAIDGDAKARQDLVPLSNLAARKERGYARASVQRLPRRLRAFTNASPPATRPPPKAAHNGQHHRRNERR